MKLSVCTFTRDSGWSPALPSHDDDEHLLIIAFAASSYANEEEPFAFLRRAFPRAALFGCSTAGEICDDRVHDDSVVVALVHFDATEIRGAVAPVASTADSAAAGAAIARALAAPSLRCVLVASDGNRVNGSALVRGIDSVVGDGVAVMGGLAGDGARFASTWVLVDGRPAPGYVSAVGLYGDAISVSHGSRGGWDRFGPERVLSRSEGNVLYEIDGRPALELYKRYLGDRVAGLPATALLFPLEIRAPGSERRLVRTILDIDESNQSMIFAGDVPEGSLGQLMRANFDRLVQGASDAAEEARPDAESSERLSLAISCVGRRLVLGQRCEEELMATLDVLPAGTRQIGFYSYGELSPLANGRCELHNQTMTISTLGERARR